MNKLLDFIERNSTAIAESIIEKLELDRKLLPVHKEDDFKKNFRGRAGTITLPDDIKAEDVIFFKMPDESEVSGITDKDRDEAWIKFLGKQEPREKEFMEIVNSLFEDQKKETIRNIKRVMGKSITKAEPDVEGIVSTIMFNLKNATEESQEAMIPQILSALTFAGSETIASLPTEVVFDPTSKLMLDYIKGKNILVKEIVEITQKSLGNHLEQQLKANLAEGLSSGESAAKMTKRVETVMGQMQKGRAKTIARTEISNALNVGANEGAVQSGVVKEKQWVTARDEDVRTKPFSHFAADTETVSLKDDYVKTGEPMRFPTDTNGSPANFINCRCSELYIPIEP